MAQPFTDLVLALPNLRFAYPLDAAGTTDIGPNGLTLTANSSPGTTSPGPVLDDDATSFNGSSQSMSRAHNAAFDFGTSDFTLGCFINPANTSAGTRMFLTHDGDGDFGSWEMWQSGTALNSRFDASLSVNATGVLTTGWQFVAVVFDRDGLGRWWRNDDWAHAGVDITSKAAANIDFTGTMWIGRRQSTGYFNGSMAWAWGCASALSEAQLDALYAARDDAAGVTGTMASSVAPSLSLSGSPRITGAAAPSVSPLVSVTGAPLITGTAASTAAPQTAATGSTTVTGTAASTVAPATAASATSRVTGTSAATVAPVTALDGTPVVAGTAAAAVAPSTAVGGTPVVTGTAASAVAPSTALLGEAQPVTGAMASSAVPQAAASGAPRVTGAVSSSVAAVASATGSGIVTGSVAVAIPMAMTAALGSAVATGAVASSVVPSTAMTGAPPFDWEHATGTVTLEPRAVGTVTVTRDTGVVTTDDGIPGVAA